MKPDLRSLKNLENTVYSIFPLKKDWYSAINILNQSQGGIIKSSSTQRIVYSTALKSRT